MTPAHLYFDDDALDRRVVAGLRARGFELATANELGRAGNADEEHLRFAVESGAVLVSCNVQDFMALHSAWLTAGRSHAGMILIVQQQYSTGEIVRRVERVLRAIDAETFRDRAEFLNVWG